MDPKDTQTQEWLHHGLIAEWSDWSGSTHPTFLHPKNFSIWTEFLLTYTIVELTINLTQIKVATSMFCLLEAWFSSQILCVYLHPSPITPHNTIKIH